jgi:hypothetical protein
MIVAAILENIRNSMGNAIDFEGKMLDVFPIGGRDGSRRVATILEDFQCRPFFTITRKAKMSADELSILWPVPLSSHSPERSRSGGTGMHPNTY